MADPPPHPFVPISRRQRYAIAALFGLYVVLALVVRQSDRTPTSDWIPALLTLYVAVIVAPLFLLRRDVGWFHPLVFSSIVRLVDLVRRFTMYSTGLDWHRAVPASSDELSDLIELHLMLHTVAVVAYYAGYLVGPRLPVPKLRFTRPRALVPKLLIISGVAAIAFAVYIVQRGGLSAHIASWALGRRLQLAGTFYWIALAGLGVPACWIWLAYRRDATRSPLFWAAVLAALAIAYLSAGSRSSVVYPAFVGLIVWMMRERKVSYTRLLAGGLLALYALAVLGAYRQSGWSGGTSDLEAAIDTAFLDSVDRSGTELEDRASTGEGSLPILARVPDDVPLLYGESYIALLTLPVPRGLWPEKPGLVDGRVGEIFFHSLAGIPPGAIGEAYWNFHFVGVIVVFFLFGVFQKWAARCFLVYADKPGGWVIYASALLILRDPATTAVVTWLLGLVPVVIMLVALGALRLGGARPRIAPAVAVRGSGARV